MLDPLCWLSSTSGNPSLRLVDFAWFSPTDFSLSKWISWAFESGQQDNISQSNRPGGLNRPKKFAGGTFLLKYFIVPLTYRKGTNFYRHLNCNRMRITRIRLLDSTVFNFKKQYEANIWFIMNFSSIIYWRKVSWLPLNVFGALLDISKINSKNHKFKQREKSINTISPFSAHFQGSGGRQEQSL